MNAIPIVQEEHFNERRVTPPWHTPQDCFKLIDVQDMVDKIEGRLGDGSDRMTRIEESIEDQRVRSDRIEHNIKGIRTNLNENTQLTQELLEIIQTGKGLFKLAGRIGGWIRTAILWVLPVVTAIVSFWYGITGQQPK